MVLCRLVMNLHFHLLGLGLSEGGPESYTWAYESSDFIWASLWDTLVGSIWTSLYWIYFHQTPFFISNSKCCGTLTHHKYELGQKVGSVGLLKPISLLTSANTVAWVWVPHLIGPAGK
ncbi:hypothetical protein HS088_TW23G00964 [Tripterygium wilfordii]|uniref:Uncharacterized protein n=1 Tax=Tripterygium wilfordii TaxID=458696 RepID=A0A7J7BWH0_TRIWF|nr:hypothetical protein HS088_TW23G00964 [Tripterygium wilfordii]